jgi:hypothetical protein
MGDVVNVGVDGGITGVMEDDVGVGALVPPPAQADRREAMSRMGTKYSTDML